MFVLMMAWMITNYLGGGSASITNIIVVTIVEETIQTPMMTLKMKTQKMKTQKMMSMKVLSTKVLSMKGTDTQSAEHDVGAGIARLEIQ